MMTSNSNVCVVVTAYYPDASNFIRIMDRLLQMGVGEVIIIQNGGAIPDLSAYSFVKIHQCNRNLGSAGGYHLGIELALASACDFIWLLDQDNFPALDALDKLKQGWESSVTQMSQDQLMLLSCRPLLFHHLYPHQSNNSWSLGPKPNSFLGFHFSQSLSILKNRLGPPSDKIRKLPKRIENLPLQNAYYGGLFFHKTAVATGIRP
ncbi:MAG: hypothetical protein AAFO69_09285, partial [Bacteroidota bacterium]